RRETGSVLLAGALRRPEPLISAQLLDPGACRALPRVRPAEEVLLLFCAYRARVQAAESTYQFVRSSPAARGRQSPFGDDGAIWQSAAPPSGRQPGCTARADLRATRCNGLQPRWEAGGPLHIDQARGDHRVALSAAWTNAARSASR